MASERNARSLRPTVAGAREGPRDDGLILLDDKPRSRSVFAKAGCLLLTKFPVIRCYLQSGGNFGPPPWGRRYMDIRRHVRLFLRTALWASLFLGLLSAGSASAQTRQQRPKPAPADSSVANQQNVEATREQLFKLLRMSPKLTAVVARDSSLLADREYVERNNPELAEFLQEHQEVTRNP